jgi:hypothetical protein
VTVVTLLTELVVTVKVAVLAPDETVTLEGTCAAEVLLLLSDTLAPPVGAAPLNVTVPVDEVPPVTLVGLTVTDDNETVDVLLPAFSATIAASQPSLGSVQLVL